MTQRQETDIERELDDNMVNVNMAMLTVFLSSNWTVILVYFKFDASFEKRDKVDECNGKKGAHYLFIV